MINYTILRQKNIRKENNSNPNIKIPIKHFQFFITQTTDCNHKIVASFNESKCIFREDCVVCDQTSVSIHHEYRKWINNKRHCKKCGHIDTKVIEFQNLGNKYYD